MKVQLFSADRELTKGVAGIQGVELVEVVSALNENSPQMDVYVISDTLFSLEAVREMKEQIPEKQWIYLARTQSNSELTRLQTICATAGILFVPPYHELNKTVRDIARHLFPHTFEMKMGNRVAFFASHPGVGATSVIQGVAHAVAELTDAKVGVLHLNPWNAGSYDRSGKSLDEIYTDLKHETLSNDQLFQSFQLVHDVYVLRGNCDMTMMYRYEPKAIARLVEMTSELFDLVLLDIGAYLDAPTSIQGMISADLHYLVTSQERKGIETFIRTHEQILNWLPFDLQSFLLVVNKASDSYDLNPKALAGRFGLTLLQEIEEIRGTALAEVDAQSQTLDAVRATQDAIHAIANGLIANYELPLKNGPRKVQQRRWPFGRSAREA
jgi:MinD-like ATPase involved in chromosome partitioning or flagellar assembly